MALEIPQPVKNYFKDKSVLVTGASGYLAGNILSDLTRMGVQTRCLSRKEKPEHLKLSGEWIRAGMNKKVWQRLIPETDVLIHLAAQTSVRFAEENPTADYEVNVKPVLELISDAREIGKKDLSILFAGTVTQCGIPEKWPVNETHQDDPITVYDQHKLEAEKLLLEAARGGVFQAVSLRLSNLYGPGPAASARDRGILNQMVEKARRAEPLTIVSACENFLRDYLYVEDAARAFLFAACFAPGLSGKYYVLGSGQGVSVGEAFKTVQSCARSVLSKVVEIQPVGRPASAIDRRNFVADAGLFRSLTGWTPQYSLAQGIECMFRGYP